MRRSTVLSLTLLLVFPGGAIQATSNVCGLGTAAKNLDHKKFISGFANGNTELVNFFTIVIETSVFGHR
jgi:hypothetical protein